MLQGKGDVMRVSRLTTFGCLLVLAGVAVSQAGCYTRLTTAKEAREFRATYPELDQNVAINLKNAIGNKGNTFVMTSSAYVDAMHRYSRGGSSPYGGAVWRFRAGSFIELHLVGHKDSPYDGTFQVSPEGTIDVGNIKDFPVANRTRAQVRDDLEQRLSKWYKNTEDPTMRPSVSVNTPSNIDANNNKSVFGTAYVLSLAVGNSSAIVRGNSGASSGTSGSGDVALVGDDTLESVMAKGKAYNEFVDWGEIVIKRRIKTQRIHEESGLPFEYTVLIVCDLQQTIYENPNLDLDIQDGDIIILHSEKSPLIVELFRTAQAIFDIHDAFQGIEFVLEDLFHRNF
jgi:hypothetical protein